TAPYNLCQEYEKERGAKEYLAWCETWSKLIYDITGPTAAFWLNLRYLELSNRARAIPIPYLLWDSVPFFMMQEVVWHYGAAVASRRAFSPRNERFLWYVKDLGNYTF